MSTFEHGYSQEYLEYLRNIKRKKKIVLVWQCSLLVGFTLLWQLAANKGWIDTFIFSSPVLICKTIANLSKSSSLFRHIFVTVLETVAGFVVGTIVGTLVSIMLWWFPTVAKIFDPYLVILNALPKVALGPLILVWVGMGIKAILVMTLAIALISTIITVYGGFIQTDEEKTLLLQSFGATKTQLLFKVLLPASYENIVNALKINIGLSWVGVIMGEFLVSKAGIGYLIMYGSQVFNLNLVMSAVIMLAIAAALMYFGISALEKIIGKRFRSN
ncbi:MAG: ABC transporter permease [Eubacteriaceae bacterium]|nr:ABC transporter permease [Eubacteriaceae bacterium]